MSLEGVQRWWDQHAGWLALIVLCVGMFTFGYLVSMLAERHRYQTDSDRLAQSYAEALNTKDQLIAKLAGTTVQAVTTASKAADTASDAAASAASAADAAKETSVKVDKATRPLGRLK